MMANSRLNTCANDIYRNCIAVELVQRCDLVGLQLATPFYEIYHEHPEKQYLTAV